MNTTWRARSDDSVTLPGVFLEPRGASQGDPVEPGDVLDGRYVVERQIGQGGEGVVFSAWDRRAHGAVAVKLLHPRLADRPAWARRLARETELARRVRHPNVCSIFEFRLWRGRAFLVMELAAGGALAEPPPRARPVDWKRRREDALGVCRGLAAIHDAGIVHRDVKPANLLRMADGRVAVADFGLAVAVGETVSLDGGTPNYLPPEVTLGEPHDVRSDVWQLGIVLHEILVERRPAWQPDAAGPCAPPPLPRGAPAQLERWIAAALGCLRWDPAGRPEDAAAVVKLLES